MSNIVLKTTKHIEHAELHDLIEKAYRIGRNDFRIEYESDDTASIYIDSFVDKGAGLSLDITNDGMKAKLSLFPPLNLGGQLDNEAVEDFILDEQKLDPELINWDTFKECFEKYTEGHIIYEDVIAEGIEKIDGRDAQYKLHFEIEEKKPKELADGSVDFKNINNIIMVEEDDNLITYIPETPGVDGKTVLGEDIPAVKGKKVTINKGNGVTYNEEKYMFQALVGGHVTFINSRLNVNPIYAVDGDVDFSEVNIDFHGTVTVSGDVLSGFEIRAKNIVIWGTARDCDLYATDDITVRTGIISTGKGITKAGNRVTADFIEGAEIYAGIAVIIKNYCYNAKIFCEGEILALSGDGVINSGELHAFSSIEAKHIGMANSSGFSLHVGVKYSLNDRVEKFIAQKANIEKTLKETDKKIKSLAKANPDIKIKEQLKKIIAHRKALFEKYDGIDDEIETLITKSMHPMPYVLAKDKIFEGINIVIYSTEYYVPEERTGTKFIYNQNVGKVIMVDPKADLEYDPRKK
ncbi:MAG: hypothetical protein C0603_04850 [Denitrovibrio sp.]|nr:MAG: hypothetical protein C0603_04850 [Denitrovibrio sp.]